MNQILNLTMHKSTGEQADAGVVDLPSDLHEEVKRLLLFTELPDTRLLADRAKTIAGQIADHARSVKAKTVMIGGAPFFMAPLTEALTAAGFTVVFAFSKRESVETVQPDGSVRKTNVFRHVGFVPAT